MSASRPGPVEVAMFSGGRGGASIARHLLATPGLRLSLVINGYDNGLSTGALRRHLPGMLGPSDFRKSLELHLDGTDPRQAALLTMLRHRLPAGGAHRALDEIVDALGRYDGVGPYAALPWPTRMALFRSLDRIRRGPGDADDVVRRGPGDADDLVRRGPGDAAGVPVLDLADCALGNLVFAGMYLRLGRDFNAAVRACARVFESPARLVNVTNGENAFLVALKQDGRLLADEADIVAPQDPTAIVDLYLLPEPLTPQRRAELETQPIERVRRALRGRGAVVTLNPQAREAVERADLIVYGPGTPHSSLLPSYLTPGLPDAIAASRAAAKVFVVNLREDYDVAGLGAAELVDRTLEYLGDPRNERRHITHVLCHRGAAPVNLDDLDGHEHRTGVRWVVADFEHPQRQGIHCGERTGCELMSIIDDAALVGLG